MLIRRATPLDAPTLAAFAGRMFRSTYGDAIPAADMEAHVREDLSEATFRRFLDRPDMGVILSEDETGPAGYAHMECRPCVVDPGPGDVDLCRFYVDVPLHGTGLAGRQLQAVLDWVRVEGHQRLWLQAWEANPRALAFYRKHGFREVGCTTFTVGTQVYRDLVLVHDPAGLG